MIVFPDVENFSREQVQVLPNVLGRDNISGSEKYKQGTINFTPHGYYYFKSLPRLLYGCLKAEFEHKIIVVNYKVQTADIDPTIINQVQKLKTCFTTWGLTIAHYLLQAQYRASGYIELLGSQNILREDEVDDFIQACVWVKDPESSLSPLDHKPENKVLYFQESENISQN